MRQQFLRPVALAAACVFLASAGQVAQSEDVDATEVVSAMKAGIDKETGRMRRLTREEEAELSAAGGLSGTELMIRLGMPETTVVMPPAADGTVAARLGIDSFDFLVVETDGQGELRVTHQSLADQVAASPEEK